VCEGFQRATLIRVLEQVAELKEIAQTETEAVRAQLSAAHERELTKVRDEAAAAMERLQEEAEVSGRAPLTRALLLHFSDVLCWDNISLRVPSQELCIPTRCVRGATREHTPLESTPHSRAHPGAMPLETTSTPPRAFG